MLGRVTMATADLQPLIESGFTGLEAEVYAFLLGESPATGYRIAQALHRPVGNIYKTVESLESKGAVIGEQEDDTRRVRAVPADELFERLERQFRQRKQAALAALADVSTDPIDDRIYRLTSPEQVFERCRAMLERCESFALATLCPAPFRELGDALQRAAARGMTVATKLFEPSECEGVQQIIDLRGMAALESGPGQWISLTVDGREWLQALLSDDARTLHHGVWSGSAFLSWTFFTGLSSDLVLAAIKRELARGASGDDIRALLERLSPLESPRSIGKLELLKRYRPKGGDR